MIIRRDVMNQLIIESVSVSLIERVVRVGD